LPHARAFLAPPAGISPPQISSLNGSACNGVFKSLSLEIVDDILNLRYLLDGVIVRIVDPKNWTGG
jgi:hypothetical protein